MDRNKTVSPCASFTIHKGTGQQYMCYFARTCSINLRTYIDHYRSLPGTLLLISMKNCQEIATFIREVTQKLQARPNSVTQQIRGLPIQSQKHYI